MSTQTTPTSAAPPKSDFIGDTPKVFIPGDGNDKKAIAKHWKQPFEWNREAEEHGTRTKVFLHHPLERISQNRRVYNRLWKLITATPHLDWLLITAMPNILKYELLYKSLENVWLGVSIHDDDAPTLLELVRSQKVANKFVWVFAPVPGIGDLDLTGIDWVLIDGQPDNEALEQEWARALFAAAKKAGAQIWFPFAEDDREAQLAEILEFGLATLDEMHAQLEAAVAREADRLAAVEAVEAADSLPTPLPVALPLPAPAPEPPREKPQQINNAVGCPSGFPSGFFRRGEDLYADTTGWTAKHKKQNEDDEDEGIIIKEGDDLFICGGGFDVVAHLQSESKHFFHLVEFVDIWGNEVQTQTPVFLFAQKDIRHLD